MVARGARIAGGVAGGVGAVLGAVDIGCAVYSLVNKTTNQKNVGEALEIITKAVKNNTANYSSEQKRALEKVLKELEALNHDVTENAKGVNGSKIAGGITSIGGGIACITGAILAGPAAPLVLMGGMIAGGVGGLTSLTATIVQLSVPHKKRFAQIITDLENNALYLMSTKKPAKK